MRYKPDGYPMSGDKPIARIENGLLTVTDNVRLPFYLQCCNDLSGVKPHFRPGKRTDALYSPE